MTATDLYYILIGETPFPVDHKEWARWFETHTKQRIVRQDTVAGKWVSTVFLGVDHGFGGRDIPTLFETMVFNTKDDGEPDMSGEDQWRWRSYREALLGHEAVVEALKNGTPFP